MEAPSPLLAHREKLDRLCGAVAARHGRSGPVYVHKGGVHHVVPLPKDARFGGARLDLSGFNAILSIDAERRRASVEPGVTFAELVDATLPLGLAPMVVPELEGITVGGAVAGCSVESASFRYGGLHDGCDEYEVVDGRGEARTLSREREPELFDMIHGSYGTLAVLTRIDLRLVPARPFVRLEYRHFDEPAAFIAALRDASAVDAGHDFVDAIVHGPRRLTMVVGWFDDGEGQRPSRYGIERPYYKSTRGLSRDLMTTRDYFFRFDADCHWLSRTVPPLEWPVVRRAVGRFVLGSTNLIRWSGRLAPLLALQKRPAVVCDVFVPARRFGDFFAWYEKSFDYWPLWVVPYRVPRPYPWIATEHAAKMQDELFMDCAIYGKPNSHPDVDASETLEKRTYELGGIKTLISRNHHTRERFWEIYNEPAYREAKRRLDPDGVFPELFEKMHRGA